MSEVKRFNAPRRVKFQESEQGEWVHVIDHDAKIVEQAQEIERLKLELGDGTAGDKYRAELYDEVWQKSREMGYDNVTMALAELSQLESLQPGVVLPDEREAFDEWFCKRHSHKPGTDTTYLSAAFEPFKAWQARAALSSPNPAEQLNKAHGEVFGYWLYPDGYPSLGIFHTDPIDSPDQDCKVIPLYTTPPSIPETSVVVEREFLSELEDSLSIQIEMLLGHDYEPEDVAIAEQRCSELRAILSSKGGDRDD